MSILDNAAIGDSVQINLELSKDRLTKEIIDAVNESSVGKICDFKITDGNGIGVILKLTNGEEQWFFAEEVSLLDKNGNVINKINGTQDNNIFLFDILSELNYENTNKVGKLINPINFFLWLMVSLKDIF